MSEGLLDFLGPDELVFTQEIGQWARNCGIVPNKTPVEINEAQKTL